MPAFFILFCWLLSRSEGKGVESPAQLGVHFYLEKDGQNITTDQKVDGGVATFSIYNVSREHGRIYACYYYDINQKRSERSESVELLVIDPHLPRPNISLSPGKMAFPGSNITVQCWVKSLNNTFYLHNARGPIRSVAPDGDMALFHISNVSSDDGGNYSCSYKFQSDFSISSETSDIANLWVFDPRLSRPTISFSPSESIALGGQIDILCESQHGQASFYLHKDGASALDWPMESDWDEGEVSINNVIWEHQGNYSCSYVLIKRPFAFSAHSDSLELLVSGAVSGLFGPVAPLLLSVS
ncbi:UNVERIFIED_CONTAM: hypothetical protein K2H54_038301 [Gekko kuhli]